MLEVLVVNGECEHGLWSENDNYTIAMLNY